MTKHWLQKSAHWRIRANADWAKRATTDHSSELRDRHRHIKGASSKFMDTTRNIPSLPPVGFISKALCTGYLAAAVFIHTTTEVLFKTLISWSGREEEKETTLRLQGPCCTQLLPWHLSCGIHLGVDTSKDWRKKLRGTDTTGVAATASTLQSISSHGNMELPSPLSGTQHNPSALDFFIPPLKAWDFRFPTASWCQWEVWSSGIKNGCSFKSQLIAD